LFALAAIIATRSPSENVPLELQNNLIRGLTRFHPRLTPVNLAALKKLSHSVDLELQSVDKALLLQTLVTYGDQQLFLQGLEVLDQMRGGPIPISAVMRAVDFSCTSNHLRSCESLWRYIKRHYQLQLPSYTTLMTVLMKVFARTAKNQDIAREIAELCLQNASNPGIALSIAKVAYMLQDRSLLRALMDSPGFTLSREIEGVSVQLDARLGQPSKLSQLATEDLTDQEFGGVVKGIAARDTELAVQTVESQERRENILAKMALANQYIDNKDLPQFRTVLSELDSLNAVPGVTLNFMLKWQLRHGSFRVAKRHYQNFRSVHFRQRMIALNTLASLASKPHELEWVRNERRFLATVRIR